MSEIILKGRLRGYQRMRMYKLLDMLYTPKELSEQIGFTQRQVYRVYIPAGCPHERDDKRHIWINGQEFRKWFDVIYAKRNLEADEIFCLTCRRAVKKVNPQRKEKDGLIYDLCACPKCGRVLARIVDNHKKRK